MARTEPDWGLFRYLTEHRLAANLLMISIIIMGVLGLNRLPMQLFPDVTPGMVTVSVVWSETGAETLVDNVIAPLEQAVLRLDQVDEVISNTRDGAGVLRIQLQPGAEVDRNLQRIRQAVEQVVLPAGVERPEVMPVTFQEPVVFLILSYAGDLAQLQPYVQDLERELQQRGIPDVVVSGAPELGFTFEVTTQELMRQQWTLSELAQRIRQGNQQFNAGQRQQEGQNAAVVIGQRRVNAAQWLDIPLRENLRLGDVVTLSTEPQTNTTRLLFNQEPALLLQLMRGPGIDSMGVSEIFAQWHQEQAEHIPPGVTLTVFGDNADFVRDNIDLLLSNGLMGLLLVMATLFVLLNANVAFWSALSIPISLLGTLALMAVLGQSLNFFSMFAMIMALGLIVDNAIVIGEETQSMRERGLPQNRVASLAVSRLAMPVVASALTTMAAFSPLLFVPGLFGEILRPIPLVIIMVLSVALVQCLLILPGQLQHSINRQQPRPPSRLRQRVQAFEERLREGFYRPLLTRLLQWRALVISVAVSALVLSLSLVGSGLVPFSEVLDIEAEDVFAEIQFVEGVDASQRTAFMQELEAALATTSSMLAQQHGLATTDLVRDLYIEEDPQAGRLFFMVRLPAPDDRPFRNHEFLALWESQLRMPLPYWVERVRMAAESGGGPGGPALTLRVQGTDSSELRAGVAAMVAALAQDPRLRNVDDDQPRRVQETQLALRPQARAIGFNEQALAAEVRAAISGVTLPDLFVDGQQVSVALQWAAHERDAPEGLARLPVRTAQGEWVALGDWVIMTERSAEAVIARRQGLQSVTVSAQLQDPEADLAALEQELVRTVLAPIAQAYGLQLVSASQQETQQLLAGLQTSAYIAAVLIFVLLAWIFQSYGWPLVIMVVIPLSLTGAILGHWVLQLPLNFLSLFGFFGLAGIVINGAIILLARYRELLTQGWAPTEAVIEASCQRFRPILLTTLTTVMGLIPILSETSVQAQLIRSMATSLAFGLTYGALLVLIVVPIGMTLLPEGSRSLRRLWQFVVNRQA